MTETTLRVATWNIRTSLAPSLVHGWRRRRQDVAGTIASLGADLVALQEARPRQVAWVRAHAPEHECIAVDRKGAGRDEHAVLLVRRGRIAIESVEARWFSDTPDVPGSRGWGSSFPRFALLVSLVDLAAADGGDGRFHVAAVHLDHQSKRSRARSCAALAEWIVASGIGPTIVLGDLNTAVDNPALSPLWGIGLRDAHAHLPAKGEGAATFHGYRGTTSGRRIDAILVSDHWGVRDATIVHDRPNGRHTSDHWPVTATLTRTRTGQGPGR